MQLAIDTACVASIMACAWVMCRIGTPVRKRLLPRQLWHLALADCTYCFGRLLMPYVQRFLWLTVAAFIVASVGFWASLVVQLQVAVGFGALYCRSGRFMSLLNRTLWLPWAVAVLEVAIVSVLINCGYTESDYYLYEGLFMGCVVGSAFFTYLFCAAFGTFSPHRVSRRADRMVWCCSWRITVGGSLHEDCDVQAPCCHISELRPNSFWNLSEHSFVFILLLCLRSSSFTLWCPMLSCGAWWWCLVVMACDACAPWFCAALRWSVLSSAAPGLLYPVHTSASLCCPRLPSCLPPVLPLCCPCVSCVCAMPVPLPVPVVCFMHRIGFPTKG